MSRSDVHFSVGFPVFAVKYFSIFGNLYLSLPFSVGFPVFCCEAFLKIGILHLQMLFWVGFPISTVGYFPKLVTHICQCLFIGPRYTWGPIYGSACPSVTKSQSLVDLTDVSPVDEDANSILADDTNRAIPGNLEMQVAPPGDQI